MNTEVKELMADFPVPDWAKESWQKDVGNFRARLAELVRDFQHYREGMPVSHCYDANRNIQERMGQVLTLFDGYLRNEVPRHDALREEWWEEQESS